MNQSTHWEGCYKEHLACALAEIERLNGDLKCVRQLQDTFWAALKKLNLASIYVSNPGLHFTERISALEAEKAKLREALLCAEETIGTWHGSIGWELYQNSPEMKKIYAALRSEP